MRAVGLFVASCMLAGLVPLVPVGTPSPPSAIFPGWPERFENRPLTPVESSEREIRFSDTFPGRIGKFTDGQRILVIRWVIRPSRKVHPAVHCFAASGFSVRPLPLFRDSEGALWGVSECEKGSERLRVRELISDTASISWPDVSSWYWQAVLGRSNGPWWAVTVIEKL
jgi:hypothetical protein